MVRQQGPRDDQPLDLLRPLVELGDLRVAHHPLDRVLVDVAVAAQHLDGVGRDAHRRVAADELADRRPAGASGAPASISWQAVYSSWRAASVAASMSASIAWTIWRSPIAGRTGGARFAYAVATSSAPWAMPTAWAAIPGRLRSNVCIAIAKPCALVAEAVRHRDADAVERELRRRAAADAHLVLEPGDLEPGAVGLDEDRATGAGSPSRRPGSSTAKTTT